MSHLEAERFKLTFVPNFFFSSDGRVNIFDIVVIINGWTGTASCDYVPPPLTTSWTVTTNPTSAALCVGSDLIINAEVTFSGVSIVKNFIIQADAPVLGAIVVPGSLSLVSQGAASWSTSNCQIFTSQGYSYFSCSGGGDLKGGDKLLISYTLRSLDTTVGVFKSEITTFPPVVLHAPVTIDMICGKPLPTTMVVPPTTPAPAFQWTSSLTGPTSICGSSSAQFTATITVLSGVGFPFLVGSGFIRDEGLVYSNPVSSLPGITCALFNPRSFSCDGIADRR